MSVLKENLTQYIQTIINNETLNSFVPEIVKHFSLKTLTKNEYFVEEGKICKHFCFIESGVLQHAIQVSNEEKTTYLGLKNTCTTSLKSFLQQTPSRKNIKALSDCNLWVISVTNFKLLLKNNKGFHQFYFNLIENQIFLIDDYRINLLTLTPEERYQKLLLNEPILLQKVPLQYLASFLGISTRHMSRIRKNVK
ncbi:MULTISPECIES: Crp/Fnr family transcriptional regulator [unclassified Tenacibaculum]|uniref:Crp/Fnr family transcriptional regulator n=1 Tax=unclassified Tenacibaculum TaxID=2635139 RepID=UPI001F3CA01B|nr:MULTISPECIES: Crp/Fnr family transcriptional regulator [unclassified Tenacibaculum]MCF2874908.1 Crp/Fnr family transcriptional regulator [Tenacibaculum sp. Cn5-1]MCF2934026.1 Crp/Fnr family transcriptional regulator [Tenacibaculum sp. Cn5-34]MCG7510236.1 Crp/Fnr family transcriptional regulator [Tenacibaculum sp. Cn5-46]